jgi:hypothetical protein
MVESHLTMLIWINDFAETWETIELPCESLSNNSFLVCWGCGAGKKGFGVRAFVAVTPCGMSVSNVVQMVGRNSNTLYQCHYFEMRKIGWICRLGSGVCQRMLWDMGGMGVECTVKVSRSRCFVASCTQLLHWQLSLPKAVRKGQCLEI